MVLSMTGYGKAECDFGCRHIIIEVKSLNSKQLDLQMRTASLYRSHDIEFRNIIVERLLRGKVDLSIQAEHRHGTDNSITMINEPVFLDYKQSIERLCKNNSMPLPDNITEIVLRIPDVYKQDNDEVSDEEIKAVLSTLNAALDNLIKFRKQEGDSLKRMFYNKLKAIEGYLKDVEQYEHARLEHIRMRLNEGLDKLAQMQKIDVDRSRLEQEMIFYIEKLDINEEKVRLKNHLEYFAATMENEDNIGKKLGFIAQEMGREINTLGSKSNQSDMQILVVKMKDELEQIKEQVLNVL